MTWSRLVRSFALSVLFVSSSIAFAATTEFRVFLDNDPNGGCTISGMDGVDRVLVTQINDSSSPAQVTRVYRQDCMGIAFGSPTDLPGTPWNASFSTTNRLLAFETRMPFMAFGTNDMPSGVIAGFQISRLSASHTVLLTADGSLMILPEAPSRRRAIDFEGQRHIVPDGQLGDWHGIAPLTFGAAGTGNQPMRLLRVLSFADANEKNLYFAVTAYLDSNYPVADDDLFLRDPDQGLSVGAPGVLGNDSDPQHQALHAQKVSDPQRGSIVLNDDGSFTYSPNHPQVMASDEFEYKVIAGGRESNTARVRISVDTGESPKTPNDDAYETPENTPLVVPAPGVLDNDPDKLVKTTLATGPTHGTVDLQDDGGFTYTPNTDFVGVDTFVYTATKKNGNNSSNVEANAFGGNATVTITVTEVISAPDANDDAYSVAEDGTLTVAAPGALGNDTDPNGDSLTGTPVPASGPAHGTLTWSPSLNGAFDYQPDADYFGADQFSYTISDGAETDTATVHLTVTAVNDPPSFTGGGDVSTNEDTPYSGAWATAISKGPSNENAQVLTFTVTPANPALFSVQPAINTSTGVLTFTPAPNANGTTSVTATLTDNGGGTNSSAPVIFNITIDPINDAPSFVKGLDESVPEDSGAHNVANWATAISPGPADEAGQSVTFNVTGNTNPGLFTVPPQVSSAGTLTYTLAADVGGTAQITLTLSDNGVPVATSAPQTFNITVNGVNDAPVNTVPAAQNTNEDTPLTFSVGGGNGIQIADPDAGAGSLQVTLAVTNGVLTANTGATILNNNSSTVTLTGTVANINASLDGLIFDPVANFEGLAQLTITTNDQGNTGSGGPQQDIDTVDINVLSVNDQPAVDSATFSLAENSANATVVGTVTFTDPDAGQTHIFAITAGNTGGAFAINASTGQITVANSAAVDFDTTPTFSLTVTVQDDSGAGNDTGTTTITVNLTDVNEAPVANDATFAVDENSPNGTVVGTVVATDSDSNAPNNTLTYAITAGNTGSAFAINASTGQITVANPIDFETLASYSLTVTVTDGGTGPLSDTATITINVNDLNEAPTATDATFAVDENSANGTVVGTVVATDPDTTAPNNTLTYAITAGNTGGAFAINASSGQITVANPIDFETLASYSLTVTVTDGGAGPLSDTATITVNINDLNEAPVVNDQAFAVDENVANGTVVGTVVAADPDTTAPNNTLTYSITAGNTGGAFAINPSTGQITVANPLNYEVTSSYALTVQVQDAGAGTLSDTATVTIDVNNLNESPVVNPAGPFSLAENSANGTAVFTATAIDPDAGQTLTWSIVGGNTGGAFAINASSGAVTVANAAVVDFETNPTFSLTVQATDNGTPNLSDTEVFVVNLTDANDAPVVNTATFTLAENSPNGTSVGTATYSDQDTGQTHTFSITGGNTGGAFAIDGSTGEITVANVAAVDFETNPTFSLTVSVLDNGAPALSGSNTVTVNLVDANEAPVVNDQSFNVDENVAIGTVVGSIAFSDPDGPSDTFSITSGNAGGEFAVNPTTGQITTAAALDFENTTSYNFTITISDAGTPLGTDTAVITIDINNLNEAPVVNPATFSVAENSANATVVGTVTFTEPDTTGQTHSYSITGGNTGGAFAINSGTGQITVANAAALDFETTPSFSLTVQVTDAGAPAPPLSGTATITVNLTNVNDAPVYNDAARSIAENSPNGMNVGAPVTATDEDAGQTLTYSITAGNTGGAFAINASTGQITVANPINFETLNSYSLTVQAQDNGAGNLTDTATVTITVLDVNEAPVANDAAFGVDENVAVATVVGTVAASDPDVGQTLTYAITAGNTGGAFAINSSTGEITTAAAIDFETVSVYNLTVTVTDNGAGTLSDTAAITINVTNVNEAPVVNAAGPFSLDENSPNATAVGTPITFTDPDTTGQTHTYSITGGNTGGAFAIDNSGQITVATSAAVNFETTPTFTLTVTVTDAGAPAPPLSGSTTVTINLNNVNDAPVYADAARSVAENSANGTNVGAPVIASDEDTGQTLTYSITGGNTGNVFAINAGTGQITVANPIDFEAASSYSLTVQATDNGAPVLSDTATVTITITDVNEAPTASDATFAVNENSANGSVVGMVVATDPDTTAPNNTLTYAITAGNTGGAFAINPSSGQITVASLIDFETLAAYSLTVTVTDGGAGPLSDSATITINVTDLNEAPTATTDSYSALANTSLHIAGGIAVPGTTVAKTGDVDNTAGHPRTTGVKANDTDPDTNPAFNTLTLTNVTGNAGPVPVPGGSQATTTTAHGSVSMHSDGSFIYTPSGGYIGADSFTYAIFDGLNTVTGTVNVTVVGPAVWYVKNDVGPAGTGTSADPFKALSSAITASAAGSTIYVMTGDGTAANLSGTNTMKANQRLWGQGIALDITASNGVVLNGLIAAGTKPLIGTGGAQETVRVLNVSGVEVRGLKIDGGTNNAIDLTATSTNAVGATVSNVDITAAGLEGIDVNAGGTGGSSLTVTGVTIVSAGTGIDYQATAAGAHAVTVQNTTFTVSAGNGFNFNRTAGTPTIAFSNNNVTCSGTAVGIAGGAATSTTITGFANNVISGTTGGSGVVISNSTFDAIPSGSFDLVNAGTLAVGASGNGVGGAAVTMSSMAGNISFTSLALFADNGAGLSASSGTAYTGSAGLQLVSTGSSDVIEATNGPAVDLNTVTATLNPLSIKSANSTTSGVSLVSVPGTFTADTGSSITNATGTDFVINGANATVTYKGTVTDDVGQLVNVSNTNGGVKWFSGAITDGDDGDGSGVSLTSNTGSTIRFSGGLVLNTGSVAAFNATGGGTVEVCDENPCNSGATGALINTITTTSGTAFNMNGTTIGTNTMEWRKISSNGATNGIVLNNVGNNAFKVKGNSAGNCGGTVTVNAVGTPATVGSPNTGDCTGGVITGSGGAGIILTSAGNVSLTRMYVQNSGTDGIQASTVGTLTLDHVFVSDNAGVGGDRGLEIGDFTTGTPVNGTVTINNSTFGPTAHDNVGIGIASGTSTWNITNTVFTGSTLDSGINFEVRNATVSAFTMDSCVLQNQFADGMQINPASGVNATISMATIQNTTFLNNNLGLDLNHDGTSNVNFRVLNNTFRTHVSHAMNIFTSASAGTGGSMTAKVDGNVIGNAGIASSGSSTGNGVRVNINGGADSTVQVSNNNIRQTPNGRGIEMISRNGTGGLDATVTGNDVNPQDTSGFPLAAIMLQSNCLSTCNTLRADIRSNTVPGGSATGEFAPNTFILFLKSSTSTAQLVDNAPASADATSEMTSHNTGSAGASGVTLIAGPINQVP